MKTQSSPNQTESAIMSPASDSVETFGTSPGFSGDAQSVSNESSKAKSRELTRAQVRLVQQRLKAAGFDPGAVDGVLGPKTRIALRKYQGSQGLSSNGTIDEKTLRSLGVE
jgi:His-Xaa-Ser repeat protein HxsA